MIPTLDGQILFTGGAMSQSAEAPRATMLTSTFGMDGLGEQDGGARGGTTVLRGFCSGYGQSGLAAALEFLRSWQDGQPHQLVDTLGVVWPMVLVRQVRPQPGIRQDSFGYWFQWVELEIQHLL